MKNIIKKDISWLEERVPDFDTFCKQHSHVFTGGGFLSGGFLRKMIHFGSYQKAVENIYKSGFAGDIDFFFDREENASIACHTFLLNPEFYPIDNTGTLLGKRTKVKAGVFMTEPNSKTGFAYEIASKKHGIKYQFIAKSTGTPEQVLNRFDIANCKIATDTKNVWMVEDWEELERNKVIRTDKIVNDYLIYRLAKYLGADYSLDQEKHDEIVKLMLGSKTYESPIKKILLNKKAIKIETLIMFYGKLGRVRLWAKEPDYSSIEDNQQLGDEDFAINLYKKRAKEEKNENSASC